MTAAEIIGQVWLALKSYEAFQAGNGRKITNVVMMGMGEPLLNFDNVVDAMELMMEDLADLVSQLRMGVGVIFDRGCVAATMALEERLQHLVQIGSGRVAAFVHDSVPPGAPGMPYRIVLSFLSARM